MADKTFFSVESDTRSLKVEAGKVVLTSSGTVSSVTGFSSASLVGTGKYQVNLGSKFPSLQSCDLTVQAVSGVFLRPQLCTDQVSASGVIEFLTLSGATPTTHSGSFGLTVNVSCYLKNSGV
jgi:hypothetical protein